MSDQLVGRACTSQITNFFVGSRAPSLVLQVSKNLKLSGFRSFLKGNLKI